MRLYAVSVSGALAALAQQLHGLGQTVGAGVRALGPVEPAHELALVGIGQLIEISSGLRVAR